MKKKNPIQNQKQIANFLFEVGMLAKTPRSGFFFLGSGEQSVSEHITRVAYIGFVLGSLSKVPVDMNKILQMALFHDLAESRISDLNYIHQKYLEKKEEQAVADVTATVPFGGQIKEVIEEYEQRECLEAKITKDADNLEFLISLKEQYDIGNERAKTWFSNITKRLFTTEAQDLAKAIIATDSDEWWFGDKNDQWWVDRNKK